MAKLLHVQDEYKLYAKKQVKCSCCHREFVSEPFVIETKVYSPRKAIRSVRCWRCVRSREACELIRQKWPGVYYSFKRGPYYHLVHNTGLQLFLDGGTE